MKSNTLSQSEINYLVSEYYDKTPIYYIANSLQCTLPQVTKELRKRGMLNEVDVSEINYIIDNSNKKDLELIRQELGLTNTQFSQICSRYKLGKRNKGLEEYTEEEIIEKVKYLLEETLNLQIGDKLVSKITLDTFKLEGGDALIRYAQENKKNHPVYKYFSAIAFLFHLAYPNQFRPCQFMHSSQTIKYFTKKRYLGELVIIMEGKMNFNIDNVPKLIKCNNFLSKKDLQFYGLGSHLYMKLFYNKEDMLEQLLIHLNQEKLKRWEVTDKLKEKLELVGINTTKCYCNDCNNTTIQIHHIHNKQNSHLVDFNVDEEYNLIPLCIEHHNMVKDMDAGILEYDDRGNWREEVVRFIKLKGEIS